MFRLIEEMMTGTRFVGFTHVLFYKLSVLDIVFCYWNDKKYDNDQAFHGQRNELLILI